MKKHGIVLCAVALATASLYSCKDAPKKEVAEHMAETRSTLAQIEKNAKKIEELNEEYREVPDEHMLENNGQNSAVYKEMKQRYKLQLDSLKKEVEATGARFIVTIITPEVGPSISNLTRYGHPFIKATCQELGIEYYDLSPAIAKQNPHEITQVPRDGHWSKKGAIFLADQLEPIFKKFEGHKSNVTYKDSERPETFGDLAPSYEEILDGGKDMPYQVKSNAQGLRMDHDIKYPKNKQYVLYMGGSQIFSPFLDNQFIATSILAQRFPNMEIMNAAMIAGCVDDFLSLWREKAKYSEPDVVLIQTNGTDITDLFFTNRNRLARSKRPYYPSPVEKAYFIERYRK